MPLQTRSASIRYGLMFGFILAVIYVVSAIIQFIAGVTLALAQSSTRVGSLAILNSVVLILECALFVVAGLMTARSFNGIPMQLSPTKAGFIAGLVVGVVEFVTTLIIELVFISPHGVSSAYYPVYAFSIPFYVRVVWGAIIILVLRICLGAALGAVGGLFGTPNPWRQEATKPK